MQIKIAIFCEGNTEIIFLEKFITEYFGIRYKNKYTVKVKPIAEFKNFKQYSVEVQNNQIDFVLIHAHGDGGVTNKVIEEAQELIIKKGYNKVLGLRDVYCCNCRTLIKKQDIIDQIEKQRAYVWNKLAQKKINSNVCNILLSIMEIEAWFICDYKVFQRINSDLTVDRINKELGINIEEIDPETTYDCPSDEIDKIFRIIGRRYRKKEWEDLRVIIEKLDYEYLITDAIEKQNKINRFKSLVKEFDSCVEQIA